MATFRFARGVNMRWQGNDIQGPAGTIFSISDDYYEEFNNQVGQVEPTLEWLVTDELGAVQAQVAGLPVSATAPISAATTTAGTNISLAVGTAPANHVLASNGAGGASFIALTTGVSSVIGTSPISASASTGAVTLSLNANYSTSTHDHSGTYQPSGTYVTAVNGTAPIAASTTTAGVATLSLSANYSTSTHDHSGVYVTSVAGTAPISASTTTAGVATLSLNANYATSTHNHSGVYQDAGTYVASVSGTAPITTSGTTAITVAATAASTSAAGVVQLSDSVSTTSSVLAATPTAVKTAYDIATAGWEAFTFGTAGVIATVPRFTLTAAVTFASGQIIHTRIVPHRDFTVTNIAMIPSTTASVPTLIRFGIYTRSGTTFTLVARTASDTTIFNNNNTKFTRALNTTGGYPATYTMIAGTEYFISVIQVASTVSTLLSSVARSSAANQGLAQQVYTQSSQTDLVASSTGSTNSTQGGLFAEVS